MTQPEALRLADELEDMTCLWSPSVNRARVDKAAAELRRLHAERAAADGVINDLVAKVRELQKENTSLSAALASSCDEQRHELWESGGIAGCERARVAERQRDALLEAYRKMKNVAAGYSNLCDGSAFTRKLEREFEAADAIARAAIKAVEGEKT